MSPFGKPAAITAGWLTPDFSSGDLSNHLISRRNYSHSTPMNLSERSSTIFKIKNERHYLQITFKKSINPPHNE